jgi:hypothetical protein
MQTALAPTPVDRTRSFAASKPAPTRITRRFRIAMAAAALLAAAVPAARADQTIPLPDVPDNLKVDAPNTPFLIGHAKGTQNYVCVPSGSSFKFVLFTPEATLFNDDGKEIITHFFSPNPDPHDAAPPANQISAGGIVRATWLSSRDASAFWGKVEDGNTSTDARFVEQGAVAWVKLSRAGTDDGGPGGSGVLADTTFVQRINPHGGLAPATGCSAATVGTTAFMPYTADYVFYKVGV